jgi:hypothetical protein
MKKQQMAIDKPVRNINIIVNLSLMGTVNIIVNANIPIPKAVANDNTTLIIAFLNIIFVRVFIVQIIQILMKVKLKINPSQIFSLV